MNRDTSLVCPSQNKLLKQQLCGGVSLLWLCSLAWKCKTEQINERDLLNASTTKKCLVGPAGQHHFILSPPDKHF